MTKRRTITILTVVGLVAADVDGAVEGGQRPHLAGEAPADVEAPALEVGAVGGAGDFAVLAVTAAGLKDPSALRGNMACSYPFSAVSTSSGCAAMDLPSSAATSGPTAFLNSSTCFSRNAAAARR